jgi:hypothetical protein
MNKSTLNALIIGSLLTVIAPCPNVAEVPSSKVTTLLPSLSPKGTELALALKPSRLCPKETKNTALVEGMSALLSWSQVWLPSNEPEADTRMARSNAPV